MLFVCRQVWNKMIALHNNRFYLILNSEELSITTQTAPRILYSFNVHYTQKGILQLSSARNTKCVLPIYVLI